MEKKFEVEIKTNLVITEEDIDDIMASALEGGITYWCDSTTVVGDYLGEFASEQIARGGTLELHDMEEDATYELTTEKLINGIKLAVEYGYYKNYGWCDGHYLDTGEIDALVADVIVQLALFGDVIYG